MSNALGHRSSADVAQHLAGPKSDPYMHQESGIQPDIL